VDKVCRPCENTFIKGSRCSKQDRALLQLGPPEYGLRWTGFSGQARSLTSEAGYRQAYWKSLRGSRCNRWLSPAQQHEQPLDVVSQAGDALGDRPDSIEPECIDGQAPQRGQDLDAVVLTVPVGVFPQRHIAHPVPAVSIDQRWRTALSRALAPVRKLVT
jgi:hypothetical protein